MAEDTDYRHQDLKKILKLQDDEVDEVRILPLMHNT